MNKLKKYDKIIYWFTVVLSVGFIVFIYATMSEERLMKNFSSDALYLPMFFRDIFIDNFPTEGIRLNAQPNFFPDMLFYFIIHAFSGNFIVSAIIYSFLQNFILLAIIFFIVKLFSDEDYFWYAALVNLFFLLIYMSSVFTNFLILRFHLINNGFHMSAFLLAVLALIFYFSYLKSEEKKFIWLFAITSFVSTLNDKLFVVLFIMPFFVTNLILILKKHNLKTTYKVFLYGVISSILGYLAYIAIDRFTNISFIPVKFEINIEKALISLKFAVDFYFKVMSSFKYETILMSIGLLSFVISTVIFFKNVFKREKDIITINFILNTFAVFFFVFVNVVPILTADFVNFSRFRYVLPFIYLGFIVLGINLSKLKIKYSKVFISVFALFSAYILLTNIIKNDIREGNKTVDFKPEYVKNLEVIADKNPDLKLGVSSYWKSRQTTMFNERGLGVYAVFYPEITPNLWTSRNKYWYFSKNKNYEPRVFNFIVLEKDEDTTKFAEIFGADSVRFIKESNISILKVPDFVYDKYDKTLKIIR